jgi:hypothetical protein
LAETKEHYVARRRREHRDYRSNVEAEEAAQLRRSQNNKDSVANTLAGQSAALAGIALGVPRGAFHLGRDFLDTSQFLGRLWDPYDAEISPPGQAAWDRVFDAGRGALDYLASRRTHPSLLARDLNTFGVGSNVYLKGRPAAPVTVGDQFENGLNAGEGLFNVAATIGGLAEARSIPELKAIYKVTDAADYLPNAAPRSLVDYMNTNYDGIGSHAPLRRATKLPNGKPLPKAILDSPLNRYLPPEGTPRGAFYRYHYAIDPSYRGGPVKRTFGGGGWSGKDLGWTKYGPAARVWYGAPTPAKAAAVGALAGLGWPIDQFCRRDNGQ